MKLFRHEILHEKRASKTSFRRERLFVADSFIELPHFAECLKAFCRSVRKASPEPIRSSGAQLQEPCELQVDEIILELQAQVRRLENVEALALALFVECFVGGFVMYSGQDGELGSRAK